MLYSKILTKEGIPAFIQSCDQVGFLLQVTLIGISYQSKLVVYVPLTDRNVSAFLKSLGREIDELLKISEF